MWMGRKKKKMEEERDVGIICVIIYDDLALEAWTQRKKRERRRGEEGDCRVCWFTLFLDFLVPNFSIIIFSRTGGHWIGQINTFLQ